MATRVNNGPGPDSHGNPDSVSEQTVVLLFVIMYIIPASMLAVSSTVLSWDTSHALSFIPPGLLYFIVLGAALYELVTFTRTKVVKPRRYLWVRFLTWLLATAASFIGAGFSFTIPICFAHHTRVDPSLVCYDHRLFFFITVMGSVMLAMFVLLIMVAACVSLGDDSRKREIHKRHTKAR